MNRAIRKVVFHEADLHATRGSVPSRHIQSFIIVVQSIVVNAGDRAALLRQMSFFNTVFNPIFTQGSSIFKVSFLALVFEKTVQDSLDGEGETEDQAQDNQRHESGTSLNEVGLYHLMERDILIGPFQKV